MTLGAVLPADLKMSIEMSGMLIGPGDLLPARNGDLAAIRQAVRFERKIRIAYADERGHATDRIIWPVALAFYDRVRIVVAWCEPRGEYRHFRIDRIVALDPDGHRLRAFAPPAG